MELEGDRNIVAGAVVTQTKSDIALGRGIGRPEVYLAVNLGHWVRRRNILRVPLLQTALGSSPNRRRLLQAA